MSFVSSDSNLFFRYFLLYNHDCKVYNHDCKVYNLCKCTYKEMGSLIVFDDFLQSKVISGSNIAIAVGESTIHFSASTILLSDAPSATAADLSLVYSGVGPNLQMKYLRSNTNIGSGNGIYITNISNGLQFTCNNPDQTVTLIGDNGVNVTGIYPSYSLTINTTVVTQPSYFIGGTPSSTLTITPAFAVINRVPSSLQQASSDWTAVAGGGMVYSGAPRAFLMQAILFGNSNTVTSTANMVLFVNSNVAYNNLSFGNITNVASTGTNRIFPNNVNINLLPGDTVLCQIRNLTNTNIMNNFAMRYYFAGI